MKNKISELLKKAIKNKEVTRTSVFRCLLGDIVSEEKKGNNDALGVVIKASKKRLDSIALYTQHGRGDLAQEEAIELFIIKSLLPKEPDLNDVKKYIANSNSPNKGLLIKNLKSVFPTVDIKQIMPYIDEKFK